MFFTRPTTIENMCAAAHIIRPMFASVYKQSPYKVIACLLAAYIRNRNVWPISWRIRLRHVPSCSSNTTKPPHTPYTHREWRGPHHPTSSSSTSSSTRKLSTPNPNREIRAPTNNILVIEKKGNWRKPKLLKSAHKIASCWMETICGGVW